MPVALGACERVDVGERLTLRVAGVAQDGGGGAHGRRTRRDAEPGQVTNAEMLAEIALAEFEIELERWASLHPVRQRDLRILRDQDLGRTDAVQFGGQFGGFGTVADAEFARGEVEPSEAPAVAVRNDPCQHALAVRFEQPLLGERAGRHDPRDPPFHRSLAGRRIPDLLADRDGPAHAHELDEIAVDAVERHAAHGNRLARRLSAGRQGDVEEPRRLFGVVVEQLVEVAHPVEEQGIGVLGLDAQVLAHHGCVRGAVHRPSQIVSEGREMPRESVQWAVLGGPFALSLPSSLPCCGAGDSSRPRRARGGRGWRPGRKWVLASITE